MWPIVPATEGFQVEIGRMKIKIAFFLVASAVSVQAAINNHPRIWLTPGKLTQLQSQYSTDANYASMKSYINAYMAAPYGSASADCTAVSDSFVADMDIAWAMVYQFEGLPRYGACAIKMREQVIA